MTVLTVTMVGASACSSPPSLSARFGFVNEEGPGAPLSKSVILVADNQDNHLFGSTFFLRTKFADSVSSTAIRPVQLDLYGQDLLAWTVKHQCPNDDNCRPFIHLGDAANMSCTGEIDRFYATMNQVSVGWVMAPGNHDGYFDGNAIPDESTADLFGINRTTWKDSCKHAGEMMDKAAFVKSYVDEKAKTNPSLKAARAAFPTSGSWRDPTNASFPAAITWKIDDEEPQHSFFVQRIDFTLPPPGGPSDKKAVGILIDTNQYENAPANVPGINVYNAGLTGDILEDQVEAIQQLIDQTDDAGRQLVLFGHHPFKDLTSRGQEMLNRLRSEEKLLIYVSAHTHAGTYFVNPGPPDDPEEWLELNVGSILDWPPEYRELQLSCFDGDCTKIAMRSQLFRLNELWFTGDAIVDDHPTCDPAWESMPKSVDFYLGYRSQHECAGLLGMGQADMLVCLSNAMLQSVKRLIEVAPTACNDPAGCDAAIMAAATTALAMPPTAPQAGDLKLEAARKLYEYESSPARLQTLTPEVSKRRSDFRLCQAYWASKYETRERRAPLVDDWLITLPNGR